MPTETQVLRLRLHGGNRRWISGKNPHVRYMFRFWKLPSFRLTRKYRKTYSLQARLSR